MITKPYFSTYIMRGLRLLSVCHCIQAAVLLTCKKNKRYYVKLCIQVKVSAVGAKFSDNDTLPTF